MSIFKQKSSKKPQTLKLWLFKHFPHLKMAWWRVYLVMPNFIPSPTPYKDYTNTDRDNQKNERSKLPLHEDASVLSIWATEAYGPAEIESLYAGLEALGWDKDGMKRDYSGSVDWIKSQRQIGTEGNFNLGVVHRAGETGYLPQDFFAPLPPEFEYLLVKIDQICPSLTCLQIVFVLNDECKNVYKNQLQIEHKTTSVPIRERFGSHQIIDPSHQKRCAIELQRVQLQGLAVAWFAKYFPGIFSSNKLAKLPTAELLTTRHELLFGESEKLQRSYDSWQNVLVRPHFRAAWKSEAHKELMLTIHENSNEDSSHIIITLPTEGLSEDAVKIYGGKDQQSFVLFTNDQLNGILVRFSVIELLSLFRRNLMKTRDELRNASPRKRRALKSLDYIQSFFESTLQIPSIVSEIASKTDKINSYRWDCDGFVGTEVDRNNSPAKLHEQLRVHTNRLATQLLSDDKITRESFKQISEVVSARESVKAQRSMEILTVVTVALAALSLWIALPPISDWHAKLPKFILNKIETNKRL